MPTHQVAAIAGDPNATITPDHAAADSANQAAPGSAEHADSRPASLAANSADHTAAITVDHAASLIPRQAAAVAEDPDAGIAAQVADVPTARGHATTSGRAMGNASATIDLRVTDLAMSSGSASLTEHAARISDSDHHGFDDRVDRAVAHLESSAGSSAQHGCADCGDGHAGLHACVFILTALTMAVLLVPLYRIAGDHLGGGPKSRQRRPRRERPPPWTVLSLAELSILRI
ncbi:DUF6153 family protein [Nocardia amikacinitolerans]|uniref:DUF6153 family protein n=1 Tax=Nocardia amikacinitolerans TaxID=756689 RepID=UPI0020A4E865|nr:DUF6153 family protein [Nocardia amikacinitolerans]MCP2291080.1 hypothetical protein [Nocardia amikacinitolerans]